MPPKGFMRPSRRNFFQAATAAVAGAASSSAQPSPGSATLDQLTRSQTDANRRILLRGGTVLSLDSKVGDFEKADVLIEGKKISAVGPNLNVARSALVVDATDRIVMPGFIDTHHHQYETLLRSILADGLLGIGPGGPKTYISVIQ